MKCKRATKLFFPYVYGELGESDSQSIERHLSECPSCSEELIYIRRIQHLLSRKEEVVPKPHFWSRLSVRIEREGRMARSWLDLEWVTKRLAPALTALTIALFAIFSVRSLLGRGDLSIGDYLSQVWSPREDEVVLIDSPELSREDVLALLISGTRDKPIKAR